MDSVPAILIRTKGVVADRIDWELNWNAEKICPALAPDDESGLFICYLLRNKPDRRGLS